MATSIQSSLRIIPRDPETLNNRSGARGEIYYDQSKDTLRLYNSKQKGGFSLAREDLNNVSNQTILSKSIAAGLASESYVDTAISNVVGLDLTDLATEDYVDTAISNIEIPEVNLTGLATEDYVDTAISNIEIPEVNLTGLATEDYVDTAISNIEIPEVNLTGYATETYVTTAVSNLVDAAPATLNTLNELAAALGDDTNFATTVSTALGNKAPTANPTFTGTTIATGTVGFGSGMSSSILTGIGGGAVAVNVIGSISNTGRYLTYSGPDIGGNPFGPFAWSFGKSFSDANFTVYNGTTENESLTIIAADDTVSVSKLVVNGLSTLQQSTEVLNTKTSATGVVIHDFSTGAIWHHSSISANFTPNFTNVPLTDNRAISVALILIQGATPYIPNAIQINSTTATINWQDGVVPTGNANKRDLVSFTLIRADIWTVLGSLSTYG